MRASHCKTEVKLAFKLKQLYYSTKILNDIQFCTRDKIQKYKKSHGEKLFMVGNKGCLNNPKFIDDFAGLYSNTRSLGDHSVAWTKAPHGCKAVGNPH